MRIAVVGPAHPYTGGSAQHTMSLAHELSAAGHQVTLQSWSAQYPKLLYPGQLTVSQPEVELFPDTDRSLAWNRPDTWWLTGRRLAARRLDALVLSVFTPIQIIDGINGLLCPPDDVAALARAISALYEPGTLERLQQGVRPPQTRQAWHDYVVAVESAISCARRRSLDTRAS